MILLAIDPGTTKSGYVFVDQDTSKPIEIGKIENTELLQKVQLHDYHNMVIEMISGNGMAVGQEIFDTCVWVGRFFQASGCSELIKRRDVKLNICGSARANDRAITQVLIDRFAYGVGNHGKGTKKLHGWFYGFHADVWQAYALAITYIDFRKNS